MGKPTAHDHLCQPVSTIARHDVATLRENASIQQALDGIRLHGLGESIFYFYVVDGDGRLQGVVPTRRLLTAALNQSVGEIMIPQVVTLREDATLLEAHEQLARHKFLALPVVDASGRLAGVVDVAMLVEGSFEAHERERMEEMFESIGLRAAQVRDASPVRAFRFRFPWLLATIASGTVCALLSSAFDLTLAKSLVLTFFLTLVLGLGESVSMQSMTVAIQALRATRPTVQWYLSALRREVGTALLLGAACGLIVGLTVWLWRDAAGPAIAIGGSIWAVICVSSLFGLSVPTLLHAMRLDFKIAAGPVTLALADICTIGIYFSLAALLL